MDQNEIMSLGKKDNTKVPIYALTAAGVMQFLMLVMGSAFSYSAFFAANSLFIIPCILVWGSALTLGVSASAKRKMLLCLLAVTWFVVVSVQHGQWILDMRTFGLYLLPFPFAAMIRDEKAGLNIIAKFLIAAALVTVAYFVMFLFNCLPSFAKGHIFLNSSRVTAFWHANLNARILMIGIVFTCILLYQEHRVWLKWLYTGIIIVLLLGQALTNSRTSIFLTCAMLGGFLFFRLQNGSWKNFAISAAAALAAMVIFFFISNTTWNLHNDRLVRIYAQPKVETQDAINSEETTAETTPPGLLFKVNEETGETEVLNWTQGSLSGDMRTLNGRTEIWRACLRAIRENPSVLVWGTDDAVGLISQYCRITGVNSHNAWIEALLELGLVGLLISLIFTWITVRNAIFFIFNCKAEVWKRCVSLFSLCLLADGMLEPLIFFTAPDYQSIDFVFLLCLGYLSYWREQQSVKVES